MTTSRRARALVSFVTPWSEPAGAHTAFPGPTACRSPSTSNVGAPSIT